MSWRLLVRMRKQYAVYWAPVSVGDDGEPVYAKPVELKVRWEGTKAMLREGAMKMDATREVVYVGQKVLEGGVLWKGRLAKCPAAKKASPYEPFAGDDLVWSTVDRAKEITRYAEYPTIDARKFLRVATL